MLKKFDMFNQDYSKVAIALIFIILIVILVFNNRNNKNQVTCPEPSKVIKDHINYKYDINIDFNNEKSKVSVVKYDNKYLITYDETKYYMYYSDFYKEEQGMYVKFNDMIIPGLDNKYLFINYIDDLSYKSKVKDKCFVKDDLSICVVNDNTINVTSSNLVLNYEISDVGTVEDFDVKI